MTEFLPPDEMTLDGAGDALRSGVAAGDQETREADRTFYDTFDGLLHAERLELVHESGRLALIETESGHERAGLVTPPPTAPMLAAALPRGRCAMRWWLFAACEPCCRSSTCTAAYARCACSMTRRRRLSG